MPGTVDYYAVLQVHPTADQEVIDAAYRQLMKKYHPDRAGDDPREAAAYHARAKTINEAYSVLRDAGRRRAYDAARFGIPVTSAGAPPPPEAPPWDAPEFDVAEYLSATAPRDGASGMLGAISAAYSLLPGAYEWERNYRGDVIAVTLVPVISLMAWALATGRLNRLLGDAPLAPVAAWVLLAACAVPLIRMAPRLAAAAGPSGLLVSGLANAQLAQAHVPSWLAWLVAALISLTLAPRLFVFAVLPTLALYAILARLT